MLGFFPHICTMLNNFDIGDSLNTTDVGLQ